MATDDTSATSQVIGPETSVVLATPMVPARQVTPVSALQRAALGAALLVSTVTFIAPLVWLAWIVLAFTGLVVGAEVLQHTRGLDPSTYGGAFWIALVGLATLEGIGIRAKLQRLRGKTGVATAVLSRPALFPLLVFAVPALSLVPVDLSGTDVPDVLTTTAVLGCAMTLVLIAPFALAIWLVKATWSTWKRSEESPYRTGLAAGICAVLGFWGLTAMLAPRTPEDDAAVAAVQTMSAVVEKGFDAASSGGPVESSHSLFKAISRKVSLSGIGAERTRLVPDGGRAFRKCIDELTRTKSEGRSDIDAAIFMLIRKGTQLATAEDVVYGTVLAVCEKHASEVDEVPSYFNRAVTNNARYAWRSGRRLAYCDLTAEGVDAAVAPDSDTLDVQRAMCRLTEAERQILVLAAQGLSSAELAARLDVSESAARQRLSRARERLKSFLN